MWPTILVAVAVFGVTAFIIAMEIRKHLKGQGGTCGGNCSACQHCQKNGDITKTR